MAKNQGINWQFYKTAWLTFDGNMKQFAKYHNLNYGTVRAHIKRSDNGKVITKGKEAQENAVIQHLETYFSDKGKEIAEQMILLQSEQTQNADALTELCRSEVKKAQKLQKTLKTIDPDNPKMLRVLERLSNIAYKIAATTKAVAEITGSKLEITTPMDKVISKANHDAETMLDRYNSAETPIFEVIDPDE